MLPTAPAYFALGNIAARRGDKAIAIENYKRVAGGQGEIGVAAQSALVKLDLADHPGDYVLKRCDPDSNGNLIVSVKNNTPLTIAGVRIAVLYTDNQGVQRRADRDVGGAIAPGAVASVNTGLGPYVAGNRCPATVTAARLAD